jgi:hypothetical protein
LLTADDILDSHPQPLLIRGLVGRLTGLSPAIQLDEIVGPRQAAGVAREDPRVAALHRRINPGARS